MIILSRYVSLTIYKAKLVTVGPCIIESQKLSMYWFINKHLQLKVCQRRGYCNNGKLGSTKDFWQKGGLWTYKHVSWPHLPTPCPSPSSLFPRPPTPPSYPWTNIWQVQRSISYHVGGGDISNYFLFLCFSDFQNLWFYSVGGVLEPSNHH